MRKRHGICGKPQADGSRCMNSAGCRIPHPTTTADTASAAAAAQAAVADHNLGTGIDRDTYFDYVIDNDDYAGMADSVSADARASLKTAQPVLDDQGKEIDSLGYWLLSGASDEVSALTHSVTTDAPAEQVEAACVVASELVQAMERNDEYGEIGPSPDLNQVRQTLRCIAVHPNATERASRQAVRAEGKYSGREVLRRSRNPDLIEFALEQTGEGIWHAVEDGGAVNPALQSHRLDELIGIARRTPMSDDDAKYCAGTLASLREHPNLTGEQRTALANL